MSSGYPFPIPWHLIPANIYLNLRTIIAAVHVPSIALKRDNLKARGVKNPIDFIGVYRPDVPWLTQTLPGAHLPLFIPSNVTRTGPINLAGVDAVRPEDSEIFSWIQRAPTVLISFGSVFRFKRQGSVTMIEAIKDLVKSTDVQVLWKLKRDDFDDGFLTEAVEELNGRLRIEKWLDLEPATLLQSGHIVASVHHGAAGAFHDTLA